MFGFNWILNSLVFLVIFNLSQIISWYRTRIWQPTNSFFSFVFPLVLALVLTIVDSLRLYVIVQIIILAVVGIFLYWLFISYYRGNPK